MVQCGCAVCVASLLTLLLLVAADQLLHLAQERVLLLLLLLLLLRRSSSCSIHSRRHAAVQHNHAGTQHAHCCCGLAAVAGDALSIAAARGGVLVPLLRLLLCALEG